MYRGFKLPVTMNMDITTLQNVSVDVDQSLPTCLPQRPERAYHPDHDIERALPASHEDMETLGVRKRRNGTGIAENKTDKSSYSSPSLTSSSGIVVEKAQGLSAPKRNQDLVSKSSFC